MRSRLNPVLPSVDCTNMRLAYFEFFGCQYVLGISFLRKKNLQAICIYHRHSPYALSYLMKSINRNRYVFISYRKTESWSPEIKLTFRHIWVVLRQLRSDSEDVILLITIICNICNIQYRVSLRPAFLARSFEEILAFHYREFLISAC